MPGVNRYTASYNIVNVNPDDVYCICSVPSDTTDTIRCIICQKHQHKACLQDLDFEHPNPTNPDEVARANYILDAYACFLCCPEKHHGLMEQVAEDCQENKERIRDLIAEVVWREYCEKFEVSVGNGESKSFGVSWRRGLGKLLGGMSAVECQVCRNKMEDWASVEALREFVGKVRVDGLEVLAEVLGLREKGRLWVGA